jgi:hypothetical protein
MTVSSPNVTEIKLERLIDDMRLLRSQMVAFQRSLNGIEASLKSSEPGRTTAREQIGPMVRRRCSRDGKDRLACGRSSSRGSLALSGNMTPQPR